MAEVSKVFKRPFFWLKIFQMICGLICFGLLFHYYKDLHLFVFGFRADLLTIIIKCITIAAIVGYTFIIVLVVIAALFTYGTSLETSTMCFLLNLDGFLMFLITGSYIAGNLRKSVRTSTEVIVNNTAGLEGLAAMSIITSIPFLFDVIIYGIQKCCRNA